MANLPAFALGLSTSSFTGAQQTTQTSVCAPRIRRYTVAMADEKKPLFSNPFAKKPAQESQPTSAFMEPQPGDPGYKEPPIPAKVEQPKPAEPAEPVKPKESVVAKVAKAASEKLPVAVGDNPVVKRGLDLLKEDVLKNAPEIAGVGRQDVDSVTMKPSPGEPGFKPAAFQTVKVSELGISPFPDDKNAVGKVGGVEAVKKAALEVKKGKSAKQIKQAVLNIATKEEPEQYDIPDYLKPLPEDTPRKGLTWKNYQGR